MIKNFLLTIAALFIFSSGPAAVLAAVAPTVPCYVRLQFAEHTAAPRFDSLALANLQGNYEALTYKSTYDSAASSSSVTIYDGTGVVLSRYSFASSRIIIQEGTTLATRQTLIAQNGLDTLVIPAQHGAARIGVKDESGEVSFTTFDKNILNCAYPQDRITLPTIVSLQLGTRVPLAWSIDRRATNDESTWLKDALGMPLYKVSLWKDGVKVQDLISQTSLTSTTFYLPPFFSPGTYYIQIEVIGDSTTITKSNLFTIAATAPSPSPSSSPYTSASRGKTFIASVLYAIGDFFDSLFSR